jgi:hypothetical protein
MSLRNLIAVAFVVATAGLAFAHGPEIGPNGGRQVDAGDYHVEVVAKGTTLDVFLRDHDSDKAVMSQGFKGTAIFVVGGKSQRIPLTPAGENKLSGTSGVALPGQPKGAVQIITPKGSTVQAKFN